MELLTLEHSKWAYQVDFALYGIAILLLTAFALAVGMLIGYLANTSTHHAIHQWRSDNVWLKKPKLWHALHHGNVKHSGCYGVRSSFLNHVFGSTRRIIMTTYGKLKPLGR